MALETEVILNVNIRDLNANFNNLLVFLKSLVIKPCIIVCSETRKLVHPESFNKTGYKMYYNKSNINQNDGLVVYISVYITEMTEVININYIKIMNFNIAIENNREILSALYNFNFDILNQDALNQEFLHILLEHGSCSGFSNITGPLDNTCNSGCINNIFIKFDKISYRTFTLRIRLTIHFPLFI